MLFCTGPAWESNHHCKCHARPTEPHHIFRKPSDVSMYSITVSVIVYLHGDRKSTGTNLVDHPMYNTAMYIYRKWFVRMVNERCTKSGCFPMLFDKRKIFNSMWMFCVFARVLSFTNFFLFFFYQRGYADIFYLLTCIRCLCRSANTSNGPMYYLKQCIKKHWILIWSHCCRRTFQT